MEAISIHLNSKFSNLKVSNASAEATSIYAQFSIVLNYDLLESNSPLNRRQNRSKDGMPTTQVTSKNAHFKIVAASQRLDNLKKRSAAVQDKMLKNSGELTKAIHKITEFNSVTAATREVL